MLYVLEKDFKSIILSFFKGVKETIPEELYKNNVPSNKEYQ